MFHVRREPRLVLACPNSVAQYNKYKQYLINSKIPDGESTTVYRCGPMIDLCVGPHIPDTGRIEAMKVVKVRRRPLASSGTSSDRRTGLVVLLPRRPQQRVAPAHLRHLLPRQAAHEGAREVCARGRRTGSSQDRQGALHAFCLATLIATLRAGAGALLFQRHQPGKLLLAATRHAHLQHPRGDDQGSDNLWLLAREDSMDKYRLSTTSVASPR